MNATPVGPALLAALALLAATLAPARSGADESGCPEAGASAARQARAWRAWATTGAPPPPRAVAHAASLPDSDPEDIVLQIDERYDLPADAWDLAIGDINGDGRPDLAAATASGVTIRLQGEDGGFHMRVDIPLPVTAVTAGIADFDGDGLADIACTLYTHELLVLRNLGGTDFTPLAPHATGLYPGAMAIGDFDRDGRPDVAVVNPEENSIQVFRGTGGGDFAAPASFIVGSWPGDLIVADLDGDGWPDIATADSGCLSVSVLLNRGDGTFRPRIQSPLAFSPTELAAGDLDGNGAMDLAIIGYAGVLVLENTSAGRFVERFAWPLPQHGDTESLALGDLDADGRLDIVATTGDSDQDCFYYPDQRGYALFGNGGWDFALHAEYLVAPAPWRTLISDLRGAGQNDVVVLGINVWNCAVEHGISILRGQQTRRLQSQLFVPIPEASNGRNIDDYNFLLSIHAQPAPPGTPADFLVGLDDGIVRVSNRGDGTFEGRERLGRGRIRAFRDVDGDGREDLLVALADTLEVRLGLPDGRYLPVWSAAPMVVQALVDADDDGLPEIVEWSADRALTLRPNLGGGTFGEPVPTGITSPFPPEYGVMVGTGDLDRDGIEEMLVVNTIWVQDSLTVFRRTSGFAFEQVSSTEIQPPPGDYPWTAYHAHTVLAADIDGDGSVEIVVLTSTSDSGGYLTILENVSGWSYAMRDHIPRVGPEPTGLAAVDLDADGLIELAVTDGYTDGEGRLRLYRIGQDGRLAALPQQFPGRYPIGVAIADFDGDGRPDFAVPSRHGGHVAVIFNGSEPQPPTSTLASLVQTRVEADRVEIVWHTSLPAVLVERWTAGGWQSVVERIPDGSGLVRHEERDLRPGERVGWRLGWPAGHALAGSEVWVEVPQRPLLALRPHGGNPMRTRSIELMLAMTRAGDVSVELLDLAGRAVHRSRFDAPAGESVLRISGRPLPPGVYWARASHDGAEARTRIVVLH